MEEEAIVELRPARINERFIAYVLDAAPFALGYLLTLWKLSPAPGVPPAPALSRHVALAWLAAYVAYQFLGNASGATAGKRLMGLRVVRRDGTPLGAGRSLLRALAYLVSTPFFNFGFLLALAHSESRALHDLIAGSVVIEPEPKNRAEAVVLFLGAALTLVAMYAGTLYLNISRPTRSDVLAVEKARDGLRVLAQIQEEHKSRRGAYTSSLAELAAASGDAAQFAASMNEIFDPHKFSISAGNRGYRMSAVARDRRGTRVSISGPPPTSDR